MTLNGLIAIICVMARNSVAFVASYVKVVELLIC